jgi:xanthine dehydrogenase molybdopterin-binding subunit B
LIDQIEGAFIQGMGWFNHRRFSMGLTGKPLAII